MSHGGSRSRPPAGAPIRLRIDTITVPAGSRREGERIAAALRDELGRLLANAAPPGEAHCVETIRAGRVPFDPRAPADRTGARLARAIATGIGGLR